MQSFMPQQQCAFHAIFQVIFYGLSCPPNEYGLMAASQLQPHPRPARLPPRPPPAWICPPLSQKSPCAMQTWSVMQGRHTACFGCWADAVASVDPVAAASGSPTQVLGLQPESPETVSSELAILVPVETTPSVA